MTPEKRVPSVEKRELFNLFNFYFVPYRSAIYGGQPIPGRGSCYSTVSLFCDEN
jgi:hypothetical protein